MSNSNNKFEIDNPLLKLTEEQKKKIKELKEISLKWDVPKTEREWMSDMTYFRFLSGWAWNIEDAKKALDEAWKWRAEFKPYEIKLKDIENVARTGYLFAHGFTKKGQPIVYLKMGKDSVENDEDGVKLKFKNVVHMIEQSIKNMPEGVYNCCWIIDMKDSSLSLSTVKQTISMFKEMGDHYCERLGKCIVLNYSFWMGAIWSICKLFLHANTVQKYFLVKASKPADMLKEISPFVDKEVLLAEYGGSNNFTFSFDTAFKQEQLDKETKETEKQEESNEESKSTD